MIPDIPLLDGMAVSWADAVIKIQKNGAPLLSMKDISAINTGTSVTIGTARGPGSIIRKRTTGSKEHTASLDLYRDGYNEALRRLQGFAPRRGPYAQISLVTFDISYRYTPPVSFQIYETRIKGCRIIGRDLNSSEGDDPDVVTLPLSVMEITDVIDGQEIVML